LVCPNADVAGAGWLNADVVVDGCAVAAAPNTETGFACPKADAVDVVAG